jgi:hypothetical protein
VALHIGYELDVPAPHAHHAYMRRNRSAAPLQYTLRNVPAVVDRTLRRKALRSQRSLNDVALEALARGAGVEQEVAEQHDLDFLFGSWVEDAAVDDALADQRRIDPALWR